MALTLLSSPSLLSPPSFVDSFDNQRSDQDMRTISIQVDHSNPVEIDEGINDTTVWSVDQVETPSESPSPPLVDTSGEASESRMRRLSAVDQHHLHVDVVPSFPAPWSGSHQIGQFIGKRKGIQGKNNSCYLDAMFFALFTVTDAFDWILTRPRKRTDVGLYDEIRLCLKDQIVAPLRRDGFVEQWSVMRLRRLISHALPDSRGWTDEEKDPEELINALFGRILCVDPDIRLTTGQTSYICQLVPEKTWRKTTLTSVQTLLERTFFCSNVLLQSMPDQFIVQLPRYGKQKLYDYIVPTLTLDLSNILANRDRQCGICEAPAKFQCKECCRLETSEYELTYFCKSCFGKYHRAQQTFCHHKPTSLPRPTSPIDRKMTPSLELASVVCIESSHFVSFVRVRGERSSKWLFFDSMADREGGDITGHNIPEVVECADFFDQLLRPQNRHLLIDALPVKGSSHTRRSSNTLPPGFDRLIQDCHVCIYTRQSE